jgi:dTDP-glucose 4,6-dehydratase
MRVLVTGSAGFVGHYVIEKLVNETDWEIIGMERLSYSGNLARLSSMDTKGRYTSIHHDLKSPIGDLLQKQIGDVDYIIHIGANSHVDRSIEDPLSFVMDNVVGTCNILDFARTQKDRLKCFLYFSTDEVFGPAPNGIKYDEYDRYNSTNPYSASKAGGEELAVAYRNTYDLPVVVTHTMNVFGNRQHPEKFIPKCIRKIAHGEIIEIHSDETRTIPGSRHYIHGDDVADGVLFILKSIPSAGVGVCPGNIPCPKFNLVGPEEVNNLELAQMIADVMGKQLNYNLVDFHSSRPGHDLRYAISGERLAKLGWTPKESLRQRISEVVEWTMNNKMWM